MNCWKPKSQDMVISSRAVPIRQTAGVRKGSTTIPRGVGQQAIGCSKRSLCRNAWDEIVWHSAKAEMRLTTAGRCSGLLNRTDELIFEVNRDALEEVVKTNSDLMVRGVKSLMPGVLIKTEATAMTRWTKDEDGEYIIKLTA